MSSWWRRRYAPPIRRLLKEPHCVTSQNTAFFNTDSIQQTTNEIWISPHMGPNHSEHGNGLAAYESRLTTGRSGVILMTIKMTNLALKQTPPVSNASLSVSITSFFFLIRLLGNVISSKGQFYLQAKQTFPVFPFIYLPAFSFLNLLWTCSQSVQPAALKYIDRTSGMDGHTCRPSPVYCTVQTADTLTRGSRGSRGSSSSKQPKARTRMWLLGLARHLDDRKTK
jgi:hypothetical protein